MDAWPQSIRIDKVIPIERREDLHPLFQETLGLRPLTSAIFIEQYLLPQYASLAPLEQLEALKYLNTHFDTITSIPTLLQAVRFTPLIYGDDNQLHQAAELVFPQPGMENIFPTRLRTPHPHYAVPPSELHDWMWYRLFRLLGMNYHAPAQTVYDTVRELTQRPPTETRDAIDRIFRYLEERWEDTYKNSSLGSRLRELKWLPADGDDNSWYEPRQLYPRLDKALVDQVAKVLGLATSNRPQKAIADALGLPQSVSNTTIVRQLLELSRANRTASKTIYARLGHAQPDELKPLTGQPVVYNEQDQRYWKADHIFLTDQRRHFGAYRAYLLDGEYRVLLKTLGAKEVPDAQDYLALIREISIQEHAEVTPEVARLLRIAYNELADSNLDLRSLAMQPCVLCADIDMKLALRQPEEAVLLPPDRFLKHLPNLPVAQYDPTGEKTLRRIGVRVLKEVLTEELEVGRDTSRPWSVSGMFGCLAYAFTRLLYHYDALDRQSTLIEQLMQIEGFRLPFIQLRYRVKLGDTTFISNLIEERVYYDAQRRHIYLAEGLSGQQRNAAIAQVLKEILGIRELSISLLATLLAEPGRDREILDEEGTKPLPARIEHEIADSDVPSFSLGGSNDAVAQADIETTRSNDPWSDSESIPELMFNTGPIEPMQNENSSSTQNTLWHEHVAETLDNFKVSPQYPGLRPKNSDRKNESTDDEARDNAILTRKPENPRDTNTSQGDGTPKQAPAYDVPAHDPHAPPLNGPTKLTSPKIETDINRLRNEILIWAEQQGVSLTAETEPVTSPNPSRRSLLPPAPQERRVARFVLSYLEVHSGFLRIVGQAGELFAHRPLQVECTTEFNQTFLLWFDWKSDPPIAYNQPELSGFFAEQEIPAGGIVYLEHQHGSIYRLYYNRQPHTVREVRIATSEAGEVQYEILEGVEINCETDDAIYRAEKRFEDRQALWLEAVDKFSVEETLCRLFMASKETWLHQDDLAAMVQAERMVSASTVEQTLLSSTFFTGDGAGNWRFNPAAALASPQNDVVHKWQRATSRLLACNDTLILAASVALQASLSELSNRIRLLQPAVTTRQPDELSILLHQLEADPYNRLLAHALQQRLHGRIAAENIDLQSDDELKVILMNAPPAVWSQVLRPALRSEVAALRQANDYGHAYALAQIWGTYDPAIDVDLLQIRKEATAWNLINIKHPSVAVVLEALALAPHLVAARKELHVSAQLELQAYMADQQANHDSDEQAVINFCAHIYRVVAARPHLQHEHQLAFDHTVHQEASKLWQHLSMLGRLQLALQLWQYIPNIKFTDVQVTELVQAAEQFLRGGERLKALLIGRVIWKLCPAAHYLRRRVATLIAQCHLQLNIPELANSRPWKADVDGRMLNELHLACQRAATTHLQRQRAFLHQLEQGDTSFLSRLLSSERLAMHELVERDITKLAESAG